MFSPRGYHAVNLRREKGSFPRSLLSLLLGLCLTTAVASAQGPDKGKKPAEPVWGATVEGYRMSLRSAKSAYSKDEQVVVQIVLQNVAATDGKVVVTNSVLTHQFTITNPNGKSVIMPAGGKNILENAQSYIKVSPLKPHEDSVAKLLLTEVFDFKMPGEYRVVASRKVYNRDDDNKKDSSVTSNTLVIKVTEPPAKKEK